MLFQEVKFFHARETASAINAIDCKPEITLLPDHVEISNCPKEFLDDWLMFSSTTRTVSSQSVLLETDFNTVLTTQNAANFIS
jgi:hypothetical protein